MSTLEALAQMSEEDNAQSVEIIISALNLYQRWMSGFSRVNHTQGDAESSAYCAVQADRAQRLLNKLNNTQPKQENQQ